MNSFTKPPGAKKFQFNNDFEEDGKRHEQEMHAHEEEIFEEPEIVAPVFSEEEIELARKEGVQHGFDQGLSEAKNSIQNTLIAVIDNAVGGLQALLAAEEQRTAMAQEIAITTTIGTIKKVWPHVLQQLGPSFIEATIRQSMDYNPEEPRIVVRVHDTMLETVVKSLPQLQEQQAFAGKVIVVADDSVIAGDCKVEWADGGLERVSRVLSKQIDEALDRTLSSISKPSQNTDAERMSS
jgi:flagellar assembly protein FliH